MIYNIYISIFIAFTNNDYKNKVFITFTNNLLINKLIMYHKVLFLK